MTVCLNTYLQENDSSVDLSHTLVALGMSQLTLRCPDDVNGPSASQPAVVPMQTIDENLFNVSDGILTDFD